MSFPLLNIWRIVKLEAMADWDAPVTESAKVHTHTPMLLLEVSQSVSAAVCMSLSPSVETRSNSSSVGWTLAQGTEHHGSVYRAGHLVPQPSHPPHDGTGAHMPVTLLVYNAAHMSLLKMRCTDPCGC
jgi:hypothetical protein